MDKKKLYTIKCAVTDRDNVAVKLVSYTDMRVEYSKFIRYDKNRKLFVGDSNIVNKISSLVKEYGIEDYLYQTGIIDLYDDGTFFANIGGHNEDSYYFESEDNKIKFVVKGETYSNGKSKVKVKDVKDGKVEYSVDGENKSGDVKSLISFLNKGGYKGGNMKKESCIKIKIKEDVKIPGTNIILEKGDVIMCYDKLAEGAPLEFRGQNPANLDSNVVVDHYIEKAKDFFSYTENKFKYPHGEYNNFIRFDYMKDRYIVFCWDDVFDNYYSGEEGETYARDPMEDIPEWLSNKINKYSGKYQRHMSYEHYMAVGYLLSVWALSPEKAMYKFITEYYLPKEQLKILKEFNSELPKTVAKLTGMNYLGCGLASHNFVEESGYNVFFIALSDPYLVLSKLKELSGADFSYEIVDNSLCLPFDGRDISAKTLNFLWSRLYKYYLNNSNR